MINYRGYNHYFTSVHSLCRAATINTRCFSLTFFHYTKDLDEFNDLEESTFFDNIIPNEYVFTRDKPFYLRVKLNQLFTTVFKRLVSSSLTKNTVYTVFIKVKYKYDSYYMAG